MFSKDIEDVELLECCCLRRQFGGLKATPSHVSTEASKTLLVAFKIRIREFQVYTGKSRVHPRRLLNTESTKAWSGLPVRRFLSRDLGTNILISRIYARTVFVRFLSGPESRRPISSRHPPRPPFFIRIRIRRLGGRGGFLFSERQHA